mmetsp:Transcript_26812/g.86073  ORF Transcript_26812/g.86073 Transcript_26812/m.86073 type:complete len:173 (-) Transcript_26812:55-573(-)
MSLRDRLAAIAATSDQKTKVEQYKECLHSAKTVEDCVTFVDHMLSDAVPLVISRQTLLSFAQYIKDLPTDVHKSVATSSLQKIQPRVVSFEEQVSVIREQLAELHEAEEDWSKAAQVLAGIDLDSGIRHLGDEYKLAKCVKISLLYLEDDDAVNAEKFIKRASFLLNTCQVA